ncbi:MAG: fasciclin domain-containing protein [Chloroflexota bacterium]|nr:fasciclin domain-containing protein [Chloroflexota bacterium]
MRKVFGLLLVAAALMLAVVPSFAQETPGTIADIVVASAAADAPEFATLLVAVQAADPAVLEALANPELSLTVFAPTDAAFAALAEALGEEAFAAVLADPAALTDILLFHVLDGAAMSTDVVAALEAGDGAAAFPTLNGQYIDVATTEEGGITVNGANLNLEMVDIMASNGIIHVIDAVILPESRTIAEIVVASSSMMDTPEFTLLLAAVGAADPSVLEALSDPEAELTVFAPTDAAFTALGEDTLNAVLADPALLSSILLYHVVPGVIHSDDLVGMLTDAENMTLEVQTAQGSTVTFMANDDGVFINDAQIVVTNVDAANGVIHVIDAVILPPME